MRQMGKIARRSLNNVLPQKGRARDGKLDSEQGGKTGKS
jgi:hypothetical protein